MDSCCSNCGKKGPTFKSYFNTSTTISGGIDCGQNPVELCEECLTPVAKSLFKTINSRCYDGEFK